MQRRPFSSLATVYDQIMADVDYQGWCEFLLRQASVRGFRGGTILDLGCGTGNAAIPLAQQGFEVTGLDSSAEMLAVARSKAPGLDWRLGEFTSFSTGTSFDLVVSLFDSLNNLLSAVDLLRTARRVASQLRPGGLFFFDANTSAGLAEPWEDGRVEAWAGDVHYCWTHSYDPLGKLARIEVCWEYEGRCFTEVHQERPIDLGEVEPLLVKAGFTEVETLTYPDGSPATSDADRIWVCARLPSRRG